MAEKSMLPSEVFAARLRDTRKDRGLSQADLAFKMTAGGRPLSKVALLRIEKVQRALTLDEALALALNLNAAPSHLLSPPDGAYVALTNNIGMDASGLRDWLTLGLVGFEPAPETQREDRLRVEFQMRMAQLAAALVDAGRSDDKVGAQAVLDAIVRSVDNYRTAAEREER